MVTCEHPAAQGNRLVTNMTFGTETTTVHHLILYVARQAEGPHQCCQLRQGASLLIVVRPSAGKADNIQVQPYGSSSASRVRIGWRDACAISFLELQAQNFEQTGNRIRMSGQQELNAPPVAALTRSPYGLLELITWVRNLTRKGYSVSNSVRQAADPTSLTSTWVAAFRELNSVFFLRIRAAFLFCFVWFGFFFVRVSG